MPASAYDKLHALSKNIALMNAMTPFWIGIRKRICPKRRSSCARSRRRSWQAWFINKRTGTALTKALSALIDIETGIIVDDKLPPPQIAALKEWRRDYLRNVKLPNSFVKQYAKTTSAATHAWISAREHNNFKAFAPHLEKIVSLNRKKADILGFTEHPYDALLDLYEPDMKTSFLSPLFCKLKHSLTQLF